MTLQATHQFPDPNLDQGPDLIQEVLKKEKLRSKDLLEEINALFVEILDIGPAIVRREMEQE